jgi:hypothetical protein
MSNLIVLISLRSVRVFDPPHRVELVASRHLEPPGYGVVHRRGGMDILLNRFLCLAFVIINVFMQF